MYKARPKRYGRQSASYVPELLVPLESRDHEHPILNLQRTIGNQAVLELLGIQNQRASSSEKLTINPPGDLYEQEADQVSEQVMSMSPPAFERGRDCDEASSKCQTEPATAASVRLHAKPASPGSLAEGVAPSVVHDVLRSPGQPLDAETRAFMEPRFGHDFSDVRVHTDEAAAQSAKAVKARAYTVGRDVVFGEGQYSPASDQGKQLLAHELTHVAQQCGPEGQSSPGTLQRDADETASGGTSVAAEAGAPGTAPGAPGQPAGIVKLVAYLHETGEVWAYFSNGDMRLVSVLRNQLKPGKYKLTPEEIPISVSNDVTVIEHESRDFVWDHPVEYSVSGPIELEIKLTPEQRIAQLPAHIRAYVTSGMGKHPSFKELESLADQGEALVKSGMTAQDLAMAKDPGAVINVEGKAPPDPDLVESLRRRGLSDFPSQEKYVESLARTMLRSRDYRAWWAGDDAARTAAAYWRDFPEQAQKEWAEYSQRRYESDKRKEAAEWREAFRRIDAAAGAVNAIAGITVAVAGGFVGAEFLAVTPGLDFAGSLEAATGAPAALWGKALAYSMLSTSLVENLINRHSEGSAAGSNPVSEASAAVLDTIGVGRVWQAITNESILTGEELHQSPTERWVGGITGLVDTTMTAFGVRDLAGSTPPRLKRPGAFTGETPIEETPSGETPSEVPPGAGEPVAPKQVAPAAPPPAEPAQPKPEITPSDPWQTTQETKPAAEEPKPQVTGEATPPAVTRPSGETTGTSPDQPSTTTGTGNAQSSPKQWNDPTITEDENIGQYKASVKKGMSDADARAQFKKGLRYDTEAHRWKRPLQTAPGTDVRGQYRFRTYEQNGKTYKQASGRLGMPNDVATHRDPPAQRTVSGGTGDDAGHLIGNRFGPPGTAENLSRQNWVANRFGSYRMLEDMWARLRLEGVEIDVQVTDVTRAGEARPFMRNVKWTETALDGTEQSFELDFANTTTAESRSRSGATPTSSGTGGKLIKVDFNNPDQN